MALIRRAPDRFTTGRLLLRRPALGDASAIFARYASDARVVKYVGWPRHEHVDATREFLSFANAEWERWPAGPYLIELRDTGTLVGSTGLLFETPQRASTGYVLAFDAWGRGIATEALTAMVDLARDLELPRLYALCHVDHSASARVLEKCGFELEGVLRRYADFPNLTPPAIGDVRCYARVDLDRAGAGADA
jgi:RimJ/RimL family protein N-acetyltransferase